MTLSQKTTTLLANTLAPKIAEQIMQSESFIEYLHEVIPAFVESELGEVEQDLHFDLSMMCMERLALCATEYN
jgi:hypothetical protein